MFFEQKIIILEWFLKDYVSNDAENVALISRINYILKCTVLTEKTVILNCNIISHYYCLYTIFNQINAAVVIIRDFI